MKHLTIAFSLLMLPLRAEDAELAKKLSNPVSDLISVPLQGNLDFGLGPGGGTKFTLNIQPVVPISLNDDWNVISRTILPVIDQQGISFGGADDEFGLGDITQSFFFSPKKSEPFIWGIGPAFLIPTATDSSLGLEKWGAGPTLVILKQQHGWTYGALANHLWDFAGDDDRAAVNATFIQPFLSYTNSHATSFTLNLESTYDWQREQWNVPANFLVSQMVKVGGHPMQVFGGIRYYLERPDSGAEWGLRFGVTFLFPKS
ncbi:transporter [Luteolibacter luteus]|uniref:Transporter n=1 Tax=Luteolibacter luteus TaxID=2728835 RepID=A0A858RQK5_9BACT|nr:transporter [Luteolibacter luteus]QJE98814.1 transporter [Luteolibacter luteus]